MLDAGSRQGRAAIMILLLGVALLLALAPFASGLLSAPVFYVVFAPLYQRLKRRLRPSLAAALTVILAVTLILVPGSWLLALIVGQAQDVVGSLVHSPLLERLKALTIGGMAVGPELVKFGETVIGGIGRGAFALVGTVTLMGFNLAIAFFLLYFMLVTEGKAWDTIRPYIPFSAQSAELLRERFRAVTISTVIGTGLTASIQGLLVGIAFVVTGLPNAAFWGVVTVVFAILPVVGSGLIWIPAAHRALPEGLPGCCPRDGPVRRTDRRKHRQRDPADRLPSLGPDPSPHHDSRRVRGRAVPRPARPSHRAAGALLFLRVGPDVQ